MVCLISCAAQEAGPALRFGESEARGCDFYPARTTRYPSSLPASTGSESMCPRTSSMDPRSLPEWEAQEREVSLRLTPERS